MAGRRCTGQKAVGGRKTLEGHWVHFGFGFRAHPAQLLRVRFEKLWELVVKPEISVKIPSPP